MSEVKAVFDSLDAPFQNFSSNVEPIIWQTTDHLVQHEFELRVPTMVGSVVKYSFSTKIGDISFSTEFHAPGQEPVVVVAPMRVPSDIETIKGTYKAEAEGTFLFIFDNSFSWFNPKTLTYNVQLFQPAFTLADNNRVRQSQRMLQTTIEDTRRAEMRLITAQDRSQTLSSDMDSLLARINALKMELDSKRHTLHVARDEVEDMNLRIRYNLQKKNGLCIRVLNKKALSRMLSFLGKTASSYLVCKYWKACVDDLNNPEATSDGSLPAEA